MPTLYEISIAIFIKDLSILSRLLDKAVAYTKTETAKNGGVTEESLIQGRLIEDMHGFVFQGTFPFPSYQIINTIFLTISQRHTVQRVTETAKGTAFRLGLIDDVTLKVVEGEETTFEALQKRIEKTIEVLKSVDVEKFNATEDREIVFKNRYGEVKTTGKGISPCFSFFFTLFFLSNGEVV